MGTRELRKAFHEEQERRIRLMLRRYNEIWRMKRDAVAVKLLTPKFWGYKRYFVVRKDLRRTNENKILEKLLSKIQTEWYSRDRTFESPMMRFDKRYVGFLYPGHKEKQSLQKIHEREWLRLDEDEKGYFIRELRYQKWSNSVYYLYVFRFPWKYELKTKTYFLKEEFIYDSSLDSEEALLHRRLFLHGLVNKIDHSTRRDKDLWDKKHKRERFRYVSGID